MGVEFPDILFAMVSAGGPGDPPEYKIGVKGRCFQGDMDLEKMELRFNQKIIALIVRFQGKIRAQ
jgi:hypothetical protein